MSETPDFIFGTFLINSFIDHSYVRTEFGGPDTGGL